MVNVAEALARAVQAHQAGQSQQAEALYRQILQAEPANADALHLLGVIAYQSGQHHAALEFIGQALVIRPQHASFHYNRGLVLYDLNWPEEAAVCFREALRLQPDYPEAYNNLGSIFLKQDRLDEAAVCYREALRLRFNFPAVHNNLGNVLKQQGRLDEAAACYREALRQQPNFPEAHYNLGGVFDKQGLLDEAVACYRETLRLRPNYAEAYNNLGSVFESQGRLDETMACYREALRLKPDFPEAHSNLGQTWLLFGQFEHGWAEYEWRRRSPRYTGRLFRQPQWDGGPLGGQPILLHAEQGLGDTLQFARYAQQVKERGGHVILECPPPVGSLLATCPWIDTLVAQGSSLPEFAVQAPLLSLPGILKTTLETIPAPVPYLYPDPERRARWQQEMQDKAVFNVGIAWQGNPLHGRDRRRSVPLEQFAPLAQVAGVRLVSLQHGPGSEQLDNRKGGWTVFDPASWPQDVAESWLEMAALVSALDLVVTVDTAVAHLAGALAVPVWVALPFVPDWRWLLEREDSPWYPSMRLFRQQSPGDWPGVFSRIADALRQLAHG